MMARFTAAVAWLRGLLGRRRIDAEILEELHDHLEREIEAHRRRGVSPEEARRLAVRDLGGLAQTIESTREVHATWLDTFWRDLRYGARLLRRSPRFTVTALTVLVLGIGSTTAIFSITYAVLVRPLPYAEPERLFFLAEQQGSGIAWPNFDDWRQRATSFEGIASSLADAVIVTGGELPRRLDSRSVTVNFFGVLGATPFRGRLFDPSDARPDAAPTAVVSHAFAVREFGSAPAAIGQTLSLRTPYTVIGVLPPGFRYVTAADVYLLLEPQVAANYRGMQSRSNRTNLYAVGRLKPGGDVTSARAEMQNIAAALALEYPDMNKGRTSVDVTPLADRVVREMAPTLTVLAGAVALLLFIACVNLASLLLNRSASRAQEFAIRTAIGGSRWSLIRQLLIEHALLIGTGGVLGALVGAAILAGLVSVAPADTPRLDEIRLDVVVLSCTTLLSCACAFLFGVLPALKVPGAGASDRVTVRPRLDPPELGAATQPADWGSGCRDGAALRIGADGPHDAAAVACRSWFRSAQPADGDVLAGRAGLAGPAKAGVLRRGGRAGTSGSRRRECRHYVFAPHPWLELVDRVHRGRQAPPAGCRPDGPAQRGNRSGERDLLRHAEDPHHPGALVRPVRHTRLSARGHHQCQSGQPVLDGACARTRWRGQDVHGRAECGCLRQQE